MAVSESIRQVVRQRARFACEYCGVTETNVGGELTIDHYEPRSQGGVDELDNLLYCCAFNVYKGDYWRQAGSLQPLWHPRRESFATHFQVLASGVLQALTDDGQVALRVLRLNRPQLVRQRQLTQLYQRLLAHEVELLEHSNGRQGTLNEREYALRLTHKELLTQLLHLEHQT